MSLQPLEDHAGIYLDNEKIELVSTRQYIKQQLKIELVNGIGVYKLLPAETLIIGRVETDEDVAHVDFFFDDLQVQACTTIDGIIDFKLLPTPLIIDFNKPSSQGELKISTSNRFAQHMMLTVVRRLGMGADLPADYKTE